MTKVTTKQSKAGWTTVAFGDVVRQVKDKVDPDESGLDRYVAGEHMDTDDLRIRRWGEIGYGYLGPAFHMRFKPGHVLYGSRRTYLRKVAVADFEGITANTTYVLESKDPKVLLPELLPFIMQTEAFNQHSVRESKGSVNPYINFSDLAWYEFALPPIEEQRRMVDLLSKVQANTDRLLDARMAAESLLEAEREMVFAESAPHQKLLGVIAGVRYGLGQPPAEVPDGVAMIRATNIDRGRIIAKDIIHIDLNAIPDSRRVLLREGEILLVRSGAYTGDSALVTREWAGSVAGYDLVISPDTGRVFPQYLANFLLAKRTVVTVLRSLSGRTAQPHLNADDVSGIAVPCPDMTIQREAGERMTQTQVGIASLELRLEGVRRLKSRFLAEIGNT